MTAKEFLKQAYYVHQEIEIKLEQISRLQSLATRTTSTLKEMPGASRAVSVVENAVMAIEENTTQLAEELNRLVEVYEKITNRIARMENPQERIILKYRYLCFLPWTTISFLLKSSERKIFLLHNQALKNFSTCLQ